MLRAGYIKPIRFLLAVVTLAASFCSAPVFGHSHGGLDAGEEQLALLSDDHRHAHEHEQQHPGDHHEPESVLSDSVYHLHGVLFGFPVSVPQAEGRVTSLGSMPFSEPFVTSASAADQLRPARPEVRRLWPDLSPAIHGQPISERILAFSARASLDSIRAAAALSPRARSVVLRC